MNKTDIPAAQKAALSLLIDDHRKVQKAFRDFAKAADGGSGGRIASETCAALKAHTELEESLFYPFVRESDPDAFGPLIDEALVEHDGAKKLIAELERMHPGDALFEARFTVLGENVEHHIHEEEDELFPALIQHDVDLSELAERMRARQAELVR
ncbi:hemerythrin domain-containing protein [Cupriavidus malaysiensis]|uniref:Hemerythrin n=1 Tax=Cupriavidus malaysiensis TaxID=367825 RepID=A0ABM6FFD1_9BURK|nr:hemerythrin domain-containing protein [Cupriavidus malaysiensis]AOZ10618.1 hemerythrin [Cupriavidus malaysiensis]